MPDIKFQSRFHTLYTESLRCVGMTWFPPTAIKSGTLLPFLAEWATVPKFFLTPEALSVVHAMDADSVSKMIKNLVQADLFRLPMPDIVVERLIKAKDGTDRHCIVRFTEVDLEADPSEKPIQYRDIDTRRIGFKSSIVCETNEGGWQVYPIALTLIPHSDGSQLMIASQNQFWWMGETDGHGFHKGLANEMGPGGDLKALWARTLINFLVLFSTRGIRHTRVEPQITRGPRLHRLIKRKAGQEPAPRFTHTVVDLDPAIKHLAGKTYKDGSGRASPRLHWRMGHTRSVPCGVGRAERKPVWIPGCMVGYDALGRVTHDYRV